MTFVSVRGRQSDSSTLDCNMLLLNRPEEELRIEDPHLHTRTHTHTLLHSTGSVDPSSRKHRETHRGLACLSLSASSQHVYCRTETSLPNMTLGPPKHDMSPNFSEERHKGYWSVVKLVFQCGTSSMADRLVEKCHHCLWNWVGVDVF